MATFWNQWIGRPGPAKRSRRKRIATRRRLKPEALEARQLLAANIFHNELMPEDVNEDGAVSALDALTIINQINRQSRGADSADGEPERRGRGRMTDVNNDGRDTALDALMVINRLNRDGIGGQDGRPVRPTEPENSPGDDPGADNPGTEDPAIDPIDDPAVDVRAIDGSGNNLENPEFGFTDSELLRVATNDYADGISEPAGEDRPSAREISNTLSAADPDGTTSERNLSAFVSAWGQFLDHDIDLSLEPDSESDVIAFDIEVPQGDPLFDPFGTGEETIHLTRSAIADGTGTSIDNPAEQVNAITAWVDGSQVYGSDQETADSLREFVGGRLLVTDDGLLPTDENGGLLAGDIRAAENVVLTSMHALFVREHNRLADEITTQNPDLSDEQVFQESRAIVIAELQSITYNEYLPALLGEDALADYAGYDASVDPSIANEFSTAAFRFGHTTLSNEFRLVGNDGEDLDEPITLANAFFTPELLEETGIDSFLKYASSTLSQEVDLEVVDSLRNFLFGAPGSGGLDLVSLNIQRGRDHGLADYNATREAYGLESAETFADITSDVDVQQKLESLYGDVNNIDLWVGLLAEDHTSDGSLGETATTIIADQFERLRDGDRFFYANTMSDREIRAIENTSLADIIERNTHLDSLQENVFFFAPEVSGTVVPDSPADAQQRPLLTALPANEIFAPINESDFDLLAMDQMQLGNEQDIESRRDADRVRGDGDREAPRAPKDDANLVVEGLTVELLDSDGSVVDSTLTDRRGNYTFTNIEQSGVYTVRIVVAMGMDVLGSSTWDVLVNDSDAEYERLNFRVTI